MKLALFVLWAALGVLATAQAPSPADVFANAKQATWAIGMLRYTSSGQVEHAAFVGSGVFVSRNHFITAEHVINARLLGRTRNVRDRIRVFKNSPQEDGFSSLKVIYEDASLDVAILESVLPAPGWMTVATAEPREGDQIGSYGYPLVEFSNMQRASAFALGRFGMVAGYGRDAGARRMIATLGSSLGNSGGPVFLLTTGHAVAIHKGQMTSSAGADVLGYSMSTPLSALLPELQKLGIIPQREFGSGLH